MPTCFVSFLLGGFTGEILNEVFVKLLRKQTGSWAWCHTPAVPATQEAEEGGSLELMSGRPA
jgi:hypothetical protein